jgi:NAD(P)-dependent dehydrogenase (short-subunit alcohol dehydrogenase family)
MVVAMRSAVVTGAGSGLGREIARVLAARGYRVHAVDLDPESAAATAAELGSAASSALDVRDEAACRVLAGEIAAADGLDLWVNNAGVLFSGAPWEQGTELAQRMIEVNYNGVVNGTLAALAPMMAAGRGHIVNVISLAGIVAAPGEVSYSASKHAAMAFTVGTQLDLRIAGVRDVRVSAVCPDGIWTPMLEDKLDDPYAAGSFSGSLQTAERVAAEVGKLSERPRPVTVVPRWRGIQLRFFDAFPGLALRLVPLVMWDARRRQRRYKRLIAAGKWP